MKIISQWNGLELHMEEENESATIAGECEVDETYI